MNHWKSSSAVGMFLLSIICLASAGCAATGPLHSQRTSPTCPKCHSCCELKVEQGEEDRYCWKIETKEICIPRVVFPWQKSCCDPGVNNGAELKTVCVLKKHEYQCPVCEYSWSPKPKVE